MNSFLYLSTTLLTTQLQFDHDNDHDTEGDQTNEELGNQLEEDKVRGAVYRDGVDMIGNQEYQTWDHPD